MTLCSMRSRQRQLSLLSPGRLGMSWFCAGRHLPATRYRMSDLPGRLGQCWLAFLRSGDWCFSRSRRGSGWARWVNAWRIGTSQSRPWLALSLGFGLLFLHFFTAFAAQATSLLFGNVLAVDIPTIWILLVLGITSLLALGVISRPLLFASIQPASWPKRRA